MTGLGYAGIDLKRIRRPFDMTVQPLPFMAKARLGTETMHIPCPKRVNEYPNRENGAKRDKHAGWDI